MLTHGVSFLSLCLLISSHCSALKVPVEDTTLDKRCGPPPTYGNFSTFRERNLDTVRRIYNLTVYPHNVPIITQGGAAVPPGLFNQNATGRVSPVGNFSGFEDSIEYFFALAPTPQGSNGVGFYEAEVLEFTSGCPEVAASVVYLRSGKVDPITGAVNKSLPTSTLTQVAFWRFDDQGQVLKYHAWIPNLQTWTSTAVGVDFGNAFIQNVTSAALCPTIQQRCNGTNQQYDSEADCVSTLQSKPFGNFDEAWGDNVVCRTIHLILTQVRPVAHCPHVGKLGGSPPDNWKCVDIDYSTDYFDDDLLFGAPEGDVFTCQGPLLSYEGDGAKMGRM